MKHLKEVSVQKAVTAGDVRVDLQKAIDQVFDVLNDVMGNVSDKIPR